MAGRPRSRSPRSPHSPQREAGGFFSAVATAWSAATNAWSKKTVTKRPEAPKKAVVAEEPRAATAEVAASETAKAAAETSETTTAATTTETAETATAAATTNETNETVAAEATEAQATCFGCGQCFKVSELRMHLESNEKCLSPAWQAAVNAISCMPGAGRTLWCPACPDEFLGKWTGASSKASGLLRHLSSASKSEMPENAPKAHAWFMSAVVNMILAQPPVPEENPPEDESALAMRLQDWISDSPPLMSIVGPLLAKPGPEAREAMRVELEKFADSPGDSVPWVCAPTLPFGSRGGDGPIEAKNKKKKAKKVESATKSTYVLYNEDIPMDVFMACEDHTRRTSDGVPVLDLLSSDEDAELTQL